MGDYSECVVPNVPCGVESWKLVKVSGCPSGVPNIPCGVESKKPVWTKAKRCHEFLMYRVELKELFLVQLAFTPQMFLMHRVELKVKETQ